MLDAFRLRALFGLRPPAVVPESCKEARLRVRDSFRRRFGHWERRGRPFRGGPMASPANAGLAQPFGVDYFVAVCGTAPPDAITNPALPPISRLTRYYVKIVGINPC